MKKMDFNVIMYSVIIGAITKLISFFNCTVQDRKCESVRIKMKLNLIK